MSKIELRPLYHYTNDGYICAGTANKCEIATQHFQSLQKAMKDSRIIGRIFCTHERNLCANNRCPIYNNVMAKISEFAQQELLNSK